MKTILSATIALFLLAGCATTKNRAIIPQSTDELREIIPLEIAAEGKSGEELYAIAKSFEEGTGVPRSYAKAKAYYEVAKKAGNEESKNALLSLENFKAQMQSKSPNGQGEIFDFYRTGVTAAQSGEYEKAYAIFYDDVFFFGDTKGIGELAGLYLKGKNVSQDVDKALSLYEYVARVLKSGNGYSSLAKVYEAPDGTYPNIAHSTDKAIAYFKLSFEGEGLESTDFKGPRYIADYLDAGYTKDDGTKVAPDYAQAERYYLLAAQGNARTFDGTSCYKLGTYYEEGRSGVAQDFSKAAAFYAKAISAPNTHATMLGIPQTYFSLGRFYENGLGVGKNLDVAKSYYEKALSACEETLSYEFAAGREAAEVTQKEAEAALKRF